MIQFYKATEWNLILGWSWILLGFITGMIMGMFFHHEGWLGGYGSFKRRMYRLAHISFFGLGTVNLLFWGTIQLLPSSEALTQIASWAFIIGAVTMPLCSILMAHFPKAHMTFAVPVISLILAGAITLVLAHSATTPYKTSITQPLTLNTK
jgi:hypothetical protein